LAFESVVIEGVVVVGVATPEWFWGLSRFVLVLALG